MQRAVIWAIALGLGHFNRHPMPTAIASAAYVAFLVLAGPLDAPISLDYGLRSADPRVQAIADGNG
jgi:hypothetical protein